MTANADYLLDSYIAMLSEARRLKAPVELLREFLTYIRSDYELLWFHRLIADKCQALLEGTLGKSRLMVFICPQVGKTTLISQCFPAWALGRNPDLRIVGTSYGAELATQFSRAIQRMVDSPEYAAIFPDTYLNSGRNRPFVKGYVSNVDTFEVVHHKGFYKAVGVGGSLTGTPADIAIIDDPVKDREEAFSPTYRERVWNWYNSVLKTRLHNDSKILFVMTRWHEDDLAGRILRTEADKWDVVCIPALCETEGDGIYRSGRHIGDALWEERHSRESLLEAREVAPSVFASLYQQRPVIEGGNIVKRDWFGTISYPEFSRRHNRQPIHFFLDTAYNKKSPSKDNDPSGILTACKIHKELYILHAERVWMEMPELLKFLPRYVSMHGGGEASVLHIEPKANGESVFQMLRRDSDLNVRKIKPPKDSKETRFKAVSPYVEGGRVYLVEGGWNEDFLAEVCSFPASPHDEFVDILGYAINGMLQYDPEELRKNAEYLSQLLRL